MGARRYHITKLNEIYELGSNQKKRNQTKGKENQTTYVFA